MQDVVVPIVQVIVVAEPFFRTVTTPEDALTPTAEEVTMSVESVRAEFIGTPDPIVADVQVVAVSFGPVPYKPRVEEAVAPPVHAATS